MVSLQGPRRSFFCFRFLYLFHKNTLLASRITDPESKFCFEPASGGCNPADKTVMVLRPTSVRCQDESSQFALDPDRGNFLAVN